MSLETIATLDELPAGHGVLEVMDAGGDTKHRWNPTNADEVACAKALFDACVKKGMTVFRQGGAGKGARLDEFDPAAGRMIAVPRLQGG